MKTGGSNEGPLQTAVRPTLPAPPGHRAGPPLHTPTSCTLLPSLCLPGDPGHQSPLGVPGPSGPRYREPPSYLLVRPQDLGHPVGHHGLIPRHREPAPKAVA